MTELQTMPTMTSTQKKPKPKTKTTKTAKKMSTSTAITSSSRFLSEDQGAVSGMEERCALIDDCKVCSTSEREEIDVCSETGKYVAFKCGNYHHDAIVGSTWTTYDSCKSTRAEEEFALVRLQMFCLLLGAMAFASVRRQKMLHASLFDRRRLHARQQQQQKQQEQQMSMSSNRGSRASSSSIISNDADLEMTSTSERASLAENDTLAVV